MGWRRTFFQRRALTWWFARIRPDGGSPLLGPWWPLLSSLAVEQRKGKRVLAQQGGSSPSAALAAVAGRSELRPAPAGWALAS